MIIGMDDSGNVVIYVDGAHAVHSDGKGHSGLFVTMGTGAMINVSKKLGVNTVSSTETRIVSTGERFPKCLWFRYFRGSQGSALKEDILMQVNQSCILLQKNYPYSNGKGSKHIHVRYFFVVDKIKNKEVKIVYCPTEKMIADFSSKPTQGKLFEFQRNTIQGIKVENFRLYKEWYKKVLQQYKLFDDLEHDLFQI